MRQRLIRSLLYLELALCFGPVLLMWLLGALLFPMWTAWMIGYVTGWVPVADVDAAHPERILWPMIMVLGGAIGVLALLRVVWLAEQPSPHRAHRRTTLSGVIVGMGSVALFNFYGSFYGSSIEFYESLAFFVLPFVGTTHLVFVARHSLMPDSLMRRRRAA